MHTRHRIGHLFIVFGLFSWLAISVIVSLSPYNASAISTGDIFSLSNAQRANNGLPGFTSNSKLNAAAQNKAQHMANNSYFAHTAPDGTTGWSFIKSQGYTYQTAGENLASSNQGASSVVQGWMNSSGHRANLLSSTYTEVGYGSVYVGDWTYEGTNYPNTYFVVALYAVPKATPPPPAPAPAPAAPVQQQSSTPAPQAATSQPVASAPEPTPTPAEEPQAEAIEAATPSTEEVAAEEPVNEPANTAIIASVTSQEDPLLSPEVAIFLAFMGLSAVMSGIYLEIRYIRQHHHLITLEDLHLPHI